MQIAVPVDLANLMNERSVRRPHALTPDMTCVCAGILDNTDGLPAPVAVSHSKVSGTLTASNYP